VPFVQPWALGVEVGVLDIDEGGVAVGAQPVPVAWAAPWTGPGAELGAKLREFVIGELDQPLATPAGRGEGSLAQAVAEGLLDVTGADVSVVHPVDVGCVQLALDGCRGYLPAGPVTEADVLRALPWASGKLGDEVYVAELRPEEVRLLESAFSVPGLPAGLARNGTSNGGGIAVGRNYLGRAERLLAREIEWIATGRGQRDGLRAVVTR
jgi:hypothetical protein